MCSRNGSRRAVAGSGQQHHVRLVDRLEAADRRAVEGQAVVERRPGRTSDAGTVKCCMTPGRSQNRMSTYSTSSSEMYLSTSSELLNTLTDSFDLDAGSSGTLWAGCCPAVTRQFRCRLTAITPRSRAATLDCSMARWIESWMPGTAADPTDQRQRLPGRAARRCRQTGPGSAGRVRPPAGRADGRLAARLRHRRRSSPARTRSRRRSSRGRCWASGSCSRRWPSRPFGFTPGMAVLGIRVVVAAVDAGRCAPGGAADGAARAGRAGAGP